MVGLYDYGTQIATLGINGNQIVFSEPGNFCGLRIHQITAKYLGDTQKLASPASSLFTQTVTGTTVLTIQGNTGGDVHYLNATVGLQ